MCCEIVGCERECVSVGVCGEGVDRVWSRALKQTKKIVAK